ncbi:hypothetical protein BJ170DRAFT_641134 [Xylariales sp. AK1849]|nr:hypothetical protein BJ170DRAFT_641134 [Xylariales sp. AK1849]
MPEFKFVDNTSIDPDARTLIRSHVMRGKNAGKTFPPRAKRGRSKDHPVAVGEDFPLVPRSVGHALSGVSFAAQLSPDSTALVRQWFHTMAKSLASPMFCLPKDHKNSFWVQFAFLDEAYLNALCALSAACNDFFRGSKGESAVALRYTTGTFQLISKKLSSPAGLTDYTVAAILSMTMYERVRGNYHKAAIHLKGLHRIVELRGGLSTLSGTRGLASKVCRADLEIALHFGTSSMFRAQHFPARQRLLEITPSLVNTTYPASALLNVDSTLRAIIIDALWLTNLMNETVVSPKIDVYTAEHLLNSICYRLVDLSPLSGPRLGSSLDNAFHLGVTALITSFYLEFGHMLVTYDLLRVSLQDAITKLSLEDPGYSDVVLWLLFVGGSSVCTEDDHVWMVPMISGLAQSLQLNTWSDVQDSLSWFPWAKAYHGPSGYYLWRKTARQTELGPSQHLLYSTNSSGG